MNLEEVLKIVRVFARLVLERVRQEVGPFFPIMFRLSADELIEGGNTLEDSLEILDYFSTRS